MKVGNLVNFSKCDNTIGNECNMTADDKFNKNMIDIATVPLYATLLLIMLSLGCTVDLKKLWAHFKRPWGLAVGVICQFGLMPFTAFILAISFKLKPLPAIAVFVMGCCPGGAISNIMSYWTDGDMDLSIFMTVFSTLLATGFMPLSLFIYSAILKQEDQNTNITTEVPYKNIGIALVFLSIPIVFGICIARKWPKQSKILLKVGTAAGAVIFFIIALTTSLLYRGAWNADLSLLIIGAINPLIGYTAGFVLALILQQSWKRCRTIAFETGTQNGQLCTTILMLSFGSEELKLMFAYPVIYIFFQIFHGLILVIVYQLYKRFRRSTSHNG
ncbi:sodium-dependent organic anion transporter-like [Pristis pectinata]|uniref:sodium-dependent organic anion transporter-like n=1 Tax=Pristis pectinata TaxID=685728 RepID=UPI00223E1052|nr:sodium-dependent organic anion transporter-like [Pristis pectinata]